MNFPKDANVSKMRRASKAQWASLVAVLCFGVSGVLGLTLVEPAQAAASGQAKAAKANLRKQPMTAAQYQEQWGPAVGSTIKSLAAMDHRGELRQLTDLAGPNGLLLFLVRSADW